jgi:hypothetical protein
MEDHEFMDHALSLPTFEEQLAFIKHTTTSVDATRMLVADGRFVQWLRANRDAIIAWYDGSK